MANNTERWRPVRDWENLYEVSDQGRVRRIGAAKRTYVGRILKPFINGKGYHQVRLSDYDRKPSPCVHVLVAEAFISPRPEGHQCDHKDGDKNNNTVANLEWVTPSVNMQNSCRLGLHKPKLGTLNGRSKLTWDDVAAIRASVKTTASLARRFGVSWTCIDQVRRNQKWRTAPPTKENHDAVQV